MHRHAGMRILSPSTNDAFASIARNVAPGWSLRWIAVVMTPVPGPSSTTTRARATSPAAVMQSASSAELAATAPTEPGLRRNCAEEPQVVRKPAGGPWRIRAVFVRRHWEEIRESAPAGFTGARGDGGARGGGG